jgi:hypothetical protein
MLFVVPDKLVHEPIAWGDIPFVVALADLAIRNWIKQHGMPNEAWQQECIRMYQLRGLEQDQGSLDLDAIVTT